MARKASPDQLAFVFDDVVLPVVRSRAFEEKLIGAGLAHNDFLLDLNRSIDVVFDHPLRRVSRLFRFPVEFVSGERTGGAGALLLHHPDLASFPEVDEIEAACGVRPIWQALDEFGRDRRIGEWWHAVDCCSDQHFQALLESRNFTSSESLAQAVRFAVESPEETPGRKKRARLSPANGRAILLEIGEAEPAIDESRAILVSRKGLWPSRITAERGNGVSYPPNNHVPGAAGAWLSIHAYEQGWFERGRHGYTDVSKSGRNLIGMAD